MNTNQSKEKIAVQYESSDKLLDQLDTYQAEISAALKEFRVKYL